MKLTITQLLRFGIVGLASNAFGFLLYIVLTKLEMGPKTAMSLLYILGVIQTFFFNSRWSFRSHGAKDGTFVRYCVSYGCGYVINLLGLLILVDYYRLPDVIIQGGMIFAVAACMFLLQKFWVFRPSPNIVIETSKQNTI